MPGLGRFLFTMATKFLKESEVLQLLCNSNDDSVSSIYSGSESRGSEVDNLAIVNYDRDDEEIVTVFGRT